MKAFGRVFEELLNACLRKSKAAADKHSTYDKKSIQMVVKVCAAFLLQAGVDQRQGIFRNEVLRLVSDVSSTLLTYDASGDLLELYSTLWHDTKARLPKALEWSSGELSVEIDCLRNILVVHHRLVLEGEEELDSMCAVALAGDGHDSELVSAQVELVLLLLDLYHRLGRLSEVLVSICRVSRGEGGLVAAPLVGPRRGVLGSEQVQRQFSCLRRALCAASSRAVEASCGAVRARQWPRVQAEGCLYGLFVPCLQRNRVRGYVRGRHQRG